GRRGVLAVAVGGLLRGVRRAAGRERRRGPRGDARGARPRSGSVAGGVQRRLLRVARRRDRRGARVPAPRERARRSRGPTLRTGRQRPRCDPRRPALRGGDRSMTWAHVDDLDAIEMPDGFVWRPIRRRFDIRAFGVNAYTALAPGEPIVEEHTESTLGHEEIYLVLRGRVRFTVDGDDHELGPGQLVHVSEPSLRRGAVALDDDTVVLALGGKPGEPHRVSAWE